MPNNIAWFRTLCSLGLPRQAALVAIARGLHEVIPSGWNRIGLVDDAARRGPGFAEHPEYLPLAGERMPSLASSPGSIASLHEEAVRRNAVGATLHAQNAAYLDSAYFREFERELDACWLLDAIIRDGGRTVAGLMLSRPRSARPFGQDEVARLELVRPWIAHALREDPTVPESGPNVVDLRGPRFAGTPTVHATLTADARGSVLFRSPGADYLLNLAESGTDPRGGAAAPRHQRLPSRVAELVRRLAAGAAGAVASTPRTRIHTPWGLLVVDAHWLTPVGADALDSARDALGLPVAIRLALHEDAWSHAARRLRDCGVPPAQVRVGVLLASGYSQPEIARRLGVAPSSVTDAVRKLYVRLDVHNAAELGTALWTRGEAD
jgi:DNA-binding CsgD family transcriptional regulator